MSIHCDSRDVILESTKSISCARSLSFYPWLSSRLYEEAKFFCGLGIRTVLFDCSGHPRPNELCREPSDDINTKCCITPPVSIEICQESEVEMNCAVNVIQMMELR